jgi:DNA replication protein DnaC
MSINIEKTMNCDKYMQRIKFYINFDLLIIDNWLLVKATPQQQEYMFEIMEGRNELHSTIFASQSCTSV